MKIKKAKAVGRPKAENKRIRCNFVILPSIKMSGAKKAFLQNKSLSRYVEDLILADVAKKGA